MTTVAVAPSRFAGLSEGLPRTYWFLWAGMLVNRLGNFVMPMLMIYLTTQKGLTIVEAGAICSLYGVGALGGNTAGGVLCDRIGRRTTLMTSCFTSAASMAAVALSATSFQLGLSVFGLGITTAMYQPSTQAMIADLVEPKYRLKAFSYSYWAVNLGFSLAALVGGFMAAKNFALLFVLDAVTTVAFGVIIWLSVPETRPAPTQPHSTGSLLTPYLDSNFWPFLACSFFGAFVLMQHLTMLPVDMTLKHLTTRDFGVAISVNGLFIVFLQTTVARFVRGSRPACFGLASLILGIGFGLTAFATTLGAYAATVAVWTLAEVILAPLNSSYVSDFAPTHMRGRYQGAFSLTWSLAMVAAPLLSPALVALTSPAAFWGLCFVIAVLSGVGLFVSTSRAERARAAPATAS